MDDEMSLDTIDGARKASETGPRISAVHGNSQWLDGGAMFGNVPRTVWAGWLAPDERGRIRLACRALLIEHEGKRLLCETGIGVFFEPKLAERFGVTEREHVLLASLARLGLREEDIDAVILSHLHFDHAGGLLPAYDDIQKNGMRLLFPKARYVVGREAYARAKAPHARDRASFIPGLVELLDASGRLTVVEGDRVPGLFEDRLRLRYSSGHTPGHMHVVFRGDRRTVFFAGDLIPGTAWVHLPVTMGYDRFPEQLIDEKAALYADAAPADWLVFYTHDPVVAASGVKADDKGRYAPVQPLTELTRLSV
jgi:glyoxylase-like metal-dependent hydrolase (beta-lactamase superfamily II)